MHFQCVLWKRTSTRIIPELHSSRIQFLHKHNNFIVSIKCVGQSFVVSTRNHTISAADSREREKDHSHLPVWPVVACTRPVVMCMRPVKWSLTQGKPKQPKQNNRNEMKPWFTMYCGHVPLTPAHVLCTPTLLTCKRQVCQPSRKHCNCCALMTYQIYRKHIPEVLFTAALSSYTGPCTMYSTLANCKRQLCQPSQKHRPREIPRSSPASPRKTPSIPPLLLGLTQSIEMVGNTVKFYWVRVQCTSVQVQYSTVKMYCRTVKSV